MKNSYSLEVVGRETGLDPEFLPFVFVLHCRVQRQTSVLFTFHLVLLAFYLKNKKWLLFAFASHLLWRRYNARNSSKRFYCMGEPRGGGLNYREKNIILFGGFFINWLDTERQTVINRVEKAFLKLEIHPYTALQWNIHLSSFKLPIREKLDPPLYCI